MDLFSPGASPRWAHQRWFARQPRVVRFLIALATILVTEFVLVTLVPRLRPEHVAATIVGAVLVAALLTWRPVRT